MAISGTVNTRKMQSLIRIRGDLMNYHIEAETKHRIRIRIGIRKLSEEQAKILKYAFSHAPGVSEVTVYKASAG